MRASGAVLRRFSGKTKSSRYRPMQADRYTSAPCEGMPREPARFGKKTRFQAGGPGGDRKFDCDPGGRNRRFWLILHGLGAFECPLKNVLIHSLTRRPNGTAEDSVAQGQHSKFGNKKKVDSIPGRGMLLGGWFVERGSCQALETQVRIAMPRSSIYLQGRNVGRFHSRP